MSAYLKVLEIFGFRGRGGFSVEVLAKITREQLLYELYSSEEYRKQYSSWGHHWAEKAPIPEIIEPEQYTFGYTLIDDPYEWGGSGKGEYYFKYT